MGAITRQHGGIEEGLGRLLVWQNLVASPMGVEKEGVFGLS